MSLSFIFKVLFALSLGSYAFSDSTGYFEHLHQKAQAKASTRWTLEEWLAQKSRIRWMDLWLARNKKSDDPFEFFLSGSGGSGSVESSSNKNQLSWGRGHVGAYAGMVGLEGLAFSGEEGRRKWEARAEFRLFGLGYQASHINVIYSYRWFKESSDLVESEGMFQNQLAGAQLSIYLTQHFGLLGMYQYIFKGESGENKSLKLEGRRFEGGAFVDYSFFRVFGTFMSEPYWKINETSKISGKARYREQGFLIGATLFL